MGCPCCWYPSGYTHTQAHNTQHTQHNRPHNRHITAQTQIHDQHEQPSSRHIDTHNDTRRHITSHPHCIRRLRHRCCVTLHALCVLVMICVCCVLFPHWCLIHGLSLCGEPLLRGCVLRTLAAHQHTRTCHIISPCTTYPTHAIERHMTCIATNKQQANNPSTQRAPHKKRRERGALHEQRTS